MPNHERRASKKIEKSPEKRNRKLLALAAGLSASIAAIVGGERAWHHYTQNTAEPTPHTAEPDKEELEAAAEKAEALRKILESAADSAPEGTKSPPERSFNLSKMSPDKESLKEFPGKEDKPVVTPDKPFRVSGDYLNWSKLEGNQERQDTYFEAVDNLSFEFSNTGDALVVTLPDEPTFELAFWVESEEINGKTLHYLKFDNGSGQDITYNNTETDPEGFSVEETRDFINGRIQSSLINHFVYGRAEGFNPFDHIER